MLRALRLPERPGPHLEELASELDQAYRGVASRLGSNPALELVADGQRPSLDRLEAEAKPASLVALRDLVARMLPRVDLPELLLEVHAWTGYLDEITHLSQANARMEDLPVSVAAVLAAAPLLVVIVVWLCWRAGPEQEPRPGAHPDHGSRKPRPRFQAVRPSRSQYPRENILALSTPDI